MKIANLPILPTIEEEVNGDATSSVLSAQAEIEQKQDDAELVDDTDMMAGIRNDLVRVLITTPISVPATLTVFRPPSRRPSPSATSPVRLFT